jgi:hypothetical protein
MQFFFLSAQSSFHQWVKRRAGERLGACLSRDALRLSDKFSHAASKVALVHVYFFSFGVDFLRSCATLAQLTFLRLRFMTAGVVLTSIALNLITLSKCVYWDPISHLTPLALFRTPKLPKICSRLASMRKKMKNIGIGSPQITRRNPCMHGMMMVRQQTSAVELQLPHC